MLHSRQTHRRLASKFSPRLGLECLEDRTVPAVLYVDSNLIDNTSIASLPSSVAVTLDRDSSTTLTTGDQVTIAIGQAGTTSKLTYNEAPVSGDVGSVYSTIAAAIAAASPGDTIEIAKGAYTEAVSVTKQLTLAGLTQLASDVVINPTTGAGITIGSSGVVIRDLTVSPAAGNGIVVPSSATTVTSLTLSDVAVNTAASSTNVGLDLAGNGSAGSTLSLNGVTVTVGTGGTGAALTISGFETVNLNNLVVPNVATAAANSITLPTSSTNATINASVTGSTATTFTASSTSLQIGPTSGTAGAAITLANVDKLNLTGGAGADTFDVTPAASGGTAISVNGGLPTGTTGDILDLNLSGLTGTAISNLAFSSTGLAGTYTFTNAANVTFSSIESLSNAAVITGTVFSDTNDDDAEDDGEAGVAGVTVQFDTGANGSVDQTTVTDSQGHYAFAVLTAGTERVRIVLPSGATQNTANPPDINATLGSVTPNVNFGVQFSSGTAGTSTVTGTVFSDTNKNGVLDGGEVGVNGLVVYLDLNGDGRLDDNEPSTVSANVNGVKGSYTLVSNVVGTTAMVRVVEKPGFLVNTTSTSVLLTDGATQTVNVGVSTKLPPQATPAELFAVGVVQGNTAKVQVLDGSGKVQYEITVPGSFPGGIRVAVGDVTGDGVEDIVVASGPGTPATVIVFDGVTHQEVFRTSPFEGFTGGVFVAVGDLTGDGIKDIILTPDQGGGPRVIVISGGNFQQVLSFFGIDDANFRGGARAGFGDLNGDGMMDLVVSAGFGGGPRIAVFDGVALVAHEFRKLMSDFFVFPDVLRNGTFVAAGDVDGDGFDDLIIGAGPGGGPRVLVLSGQVLQTQGVAAALANPLHNFFAGNPNNRNGVRVAAKDLEHNGLADIVTGDGNSGRVTAYRGGSGQQDFEFDAQDNSATANGIYVG